MKGAMPVPYIVALIIAAIVIGLLGYWLIVTLGVGGSEAAEKMCQAKLAGACVLKADDFEIDPYEYDECQGTKIAKTVRTCGDVI